MNLPLQSQPVDRTPCWSATEQNELESATPGGLGAGKGGVQPSASECAGLRGMARSLCYAAKYGISV